MWQFVFTVSQYFHSCQIKLYSLNSTPAVRQIGYPMILSQGHLSKYISRTTLLLLYQTYAAFWCKRKRHTRNGLIQAQEFGEILAIDMSRIIERKRIERYLFGLLPNANGTRSI